MCEQFEIIIVDLGTSFVASVHVDHTHASVVCPSVVSVMSLRVVVRAVALGRAVRHAVA